MHFAEKKIKINKTNIYDVRKLYEQLETHTHTHRRTHTARESYNFHEIPSPSRNQGSETFFFFLCVSRGVETLTLWSAGCASIPLMARLYAD